MACDALQQWLLADKSVPIGPDRLNEGSQLAAKFWWENKRCKENVMAFGFWPIPISSHVAYLYEFYMIWHFDTGIQGWTCLDPGPLCRCLCQAATVSPPKETTAPREAEKPLPAAPEPKEVTNPKAIGWSGTGSNHIGGLIGWYNGYNYGIIWSTIWYLGLVLKSITPARDPDQCGG